MMNESARNRKIKVRNTREFIEPSRKSEEVWKEFSRTVQADCTFETMVSTFLEWNKEKEGGEVCLNVYVPQWIGNKKTNRMIKLCGITVQAIYNDWRVCDYVKYYDVMGGKEFVPNNIIAKIPCDFIPKIIEELSQNLKKNYSNEKWRKNIAESYTSDDRKYLYNNGEFCKFATDYNYRLEDNLTVFSDFVMGAIKAKGDINKADASMLNTIYDTYDKITASKKERTFKKYVNAVYETIEYLYSIDKRIVSNLKKMLSSNTNVYVFLNAVVYDRKSYMYHYKTNIDKLTFLEFANKLHSLSCRYGIRYTLRKDFLCTGENKSESYVKPENEK